jgi:hypothetical protein
MDKTHGLKGKPSNNTGKLKTVKKTENIFAYVTAEKKQRWKEYAESRGISLSKLIERSVDSAVV